MLRDIVALIRTLWRILRTGWSGEITLVDTIEYNLALYYWREAEKEKDLLQECVEKTIKHEATPCDYCEWRSECKKVVSEGCENWWLRFLTEEERHALGDPRLPDGGIQQ